MCRLRDHAWTLTVEVGLNTFLLPVFCLDPMVGTPEDYDEYIYAGVATNDCLETIVDITSNKDIENISFSQIMDIQNAVWNCVTGYFDQDDIDSLNALPNM